MKTPPHVVLIGFMGAGKSSVGKRLAQQWGCVFIDADERIEEREGLSIPDIFREFGEGYFRNLETEFLKALWQAGHMRLVLATGGGMVERSENHELIKRLGKVIYLRADLNTVMERVPLDPHRPLLKNPDIIKQRFALRQPLYEGLADRVVDTAGKDPERVTEEIIKIMTNTR